MPIDFVRLSAYLLVGFFGLIQATQAADSRRDEHSRSNPEQVRVTRVELDLTPDFDRKELAGSAILHFKRMPGCPEGAPLDLDTRELTIEEVSESVGESEFKPVRFELGGEAGSTSKPGEDDFARILGSRLRISISDWAARVRVKYRTSPSAAALQWLEPPRTAGRRHPFLFTQSEAIHARSWIPLQDSPGVRVTYKATIRVPKPLRAVMSAEHLPNSGEEGNDQFEMTQPIPSYLIALAVGEIGFESLGTRTGVYAEPSVVPKAAHEFSDTEAMIKAVEARFGPYRWGRYDLLVLPPSFPFGGMENPKLTFATPTILAGDRSLVSLVAHELAHSWSGNLVTNATWRDFWLNEGFTVYLERRIVEDVFGRDRADMEAVLGLKELRAEIERLPAHAQVLHVDLAGRDPDEGMNSIPYEKGALFLTTLEQSVGRERFDTFLHDYFEHFAFQSITTGEFEAFLTERLLGGKEEAVSRLKVKEWIHEPGLPTGFQEPRSARFETISAEAEQWVANQRSLDSLNASEWSTHEWLHFLGSLPKDLGPDRLAQLDQAFQLTKSENSEIAHHWLLMGIRAQYEPAFPRLESFLTSIGRRKFLMPLYGELIKTPKGKDRARAIYAEARPHYHPIAVNSIDELLK